MVGSLRRFAEGFMRTPTCKRREREALGYCKLPFPEPCHHLPTISIHSILPPPFYNTKARW